MPQENSADTFCGAITYWSPSQCNVESLGNRLDAIGYGKFCPKKRTAHAALYAALKQYASGDAAGTTDLQGQVHRHQKAELNGFEVVRIERGDQQNEYKVLFSAKMLQDGTVEVWDNNIYIGARVALQDYLQDMMEEQRKIVDGSEVGTALAAVVNELAGITLRASGGVYWLPKRSLPDWRMVCNAFEGGQSGTKVYLCESSPTQQTIIAIGRAVVEDLGGRADKLIDGMDGIGEVAMENRYQKLRDLRLMMEGYEGILGVTLDELREKLSIVDNAEAIASIASL